VFFWVVGGGGGVVGGGGGGAETEAVSHFRLTSKIVLLKITTLATTVSQLYLQAAFVYIQM